MVLYVCIFFLSAALFASASDSDTLQRNDFLAVSDASEKLHQCRGQMKFSQKLGSSGKFSSQVSSSLHLQKQPQLCNRV